MNMYQVIAAEVAQGKYEPVVGTSYTARQILTELALPDTAFFRFVLNGMQSVVQNSHVTYEQLLTVPGFAESKWVYERTTHEWIPLFNFDGMTDELTNMLDLTAGLDGWWATPKGFPRDYED